VEITISRGGFLEKTYPIMIDFYDFKYWREIKGDRLVVSHMAGRA
jgi:hypothetical protein